MRKRNIQHFILAAGLALGALPLASFGAVAVGVSITLAPPVLPVYEQPPCPAVGYLWTPGYWAYGDDGYYWVPGTWILPPDPGLLWTPGYWGWDGGFYIWHGGYWGPHVGFYGGVNYGYGYTGAGYEGGYWRGGAFYYNRSVSNINNIHVTNVYNKTVINNITVNRVSYNGGAGGLTARPTARELSAAHEHHVEFTPAQREQQRLASTNRELRASVNGGKPRIAAMSRPGNFSGKNVVAARAAGGRAHPAEGRGAEAHGPAMQARSDRPPNATGQHGAGATVHQPEPAHEPSRTMTRTDRPSGHEGAGSARPPERATPRGPERPPVEHAPVAREPAA
ncbi:MAG TPA: hypothetical protein VFO44_02850, partial [Steroidobacteraceae bacterium]|nr:hypothetical protein [Steroidobacteraceae bacterium]